MTRAISTVMDVSMGILLISASMALVAYSLQDDGGTEYEPKQADYTAETLASMTLAVEYSLEPVKDHGAFDTDPVRSVDSYTRSTHGSAPALLADAAVTNAEFPAGFVDDGSAAGRLTREGVDYERSVDGALRSRLTGAHNRTQVVAVWRPYEGAAIEGTTTVGPSPPADADVSTARLTVPSGMPSVDDQRLERAYRRSRFSGGSKPIAAAIVRGYFPPEETQLALEHQGLERQLMVYRYQRMGEMFSFGWDLSPLSGNKPLKREYADAEAANGKVSTDLDDAIQRDLNSQYDADEMTAEEFADAVSVGEVTIVVRTW